MVWKPRVYLSVLKRVGGLSVVVTSLKMFGTVEPLCSCEGTGRVKNSPV